MNKKPVKVPGPDHPISIERNPARVTVTACGRVIADTSAALTLREASLQPVQYIPRSDVNMVLLERSEHRTYCPYKGECTYYHIRLGDRQIPNAVWTYEDTYSAVAVIKEHLAFYPDRIDSIEEHERST
jgi:uncharacterized protein (DUF427 family)